MRRLGGLDSGFLNMELPNQPTNTMALGVLRPAMGADGSPDLITLDYVREHMARRLGELPSFRWRVEPVPGKIHHPVYIEDPDFDLDYHLHETTVDAPGGRDEVDALFAGLAEHRLDRRHPLWQIWLVHGLADGRQAVIVKVNHCMMDGVGALTTFSRIFSGTDHVVARPPEAWHPEPVPGATRLVLDALGDHARSLGRLVAIARKTRRNLKALKAYEATAPIRVPKPTKDTSPCSFNDAFTARRAYSRTELALADVRLVKDAAGVTINDVALATVAGAARGYLLARHDLPDRPLTVSIPIGFDPDDDPTRQFGNRFASMTSTLATDIADPWERLQVISRVTAESRRAVDVLGPELMPDWLEFFPPFVAERAMRSHNRSRRQHRETADVNILVSNLRGPTERWHFGTAEVEGLNLSGPPTNGVGSNVMLWSYADHLILANLSFADSLEAPHELSDRFHDALAELVDLARAHVASAAGASA